MEGRRGIPEEGGGKGMMEEIREELIRLAEGQALFDEPLRKHTSMGVGGCVWAVVFPNRRERLGEILALLKEREIPALPVGNWTNIIARDGGYRGVIICLKNLCSVRMISGPAGATLLEAEAGASLTALVNLSAAAGLAGMEFCSGIPGSVGGAVTMNAGAYGREIKDVLEELVIMEPPGKISSWPRERLQFFYRRFVSPVKDGVIVAATFRLEKGNREEIHRRIEEIRNTRREKHPLEYRSAGSVFKNPPGHPAGRLIDEAGLKGLRIGDAQVSEKHGNFIVNRGGATAGDVLSLIEMVREQVFRKKGVRLETEIIVIGEDS